LDDEWLIAEQAAHALTALGVKITASSIRGYAHRGRLAPHRDSLPGRPRYRVGSIRELALGLCGHVSCADVRRGDVEGPACWTASDREREQARIKVERERVKAQRAAKRQAKRRDTARDNVTVTSESA